MDKKNQFDILAELIDSKKDYAENCAIVRDAIDSGKYPMDAVVDTLVAASVMPALATENIKLRDDMEGMLYEIINLKKELAIVSQEGVTIEDEKAYMTRFCNTKGKVVN